MGILTQAVARYATGFYVAVFYIVFVCVLFGGFSAYISRVNLGKDLAADVGSLDTLIFRLTRETEVQKRIDSARAQLFELENKQFDAEISRTKIEGDISNKIVRLKELFVPISTTISAYRNILSGQFQEEFRSAYRDSENDQRRKVDRLSAILSTVTFSDNASQDEMSKFTDEVKEVLTKLSSAQADITQSIVASDQTSKEIGLLKQDIENLKTSITELQKSLTAIRGKFTDEHRALIASFKNSLAGIPYSLLQIPTIILTLIVTIAAGGLGSVVAFTRKFWRGQTGTGPGRLLNNIGEGVAAAIAIFLFAGTGMLMLTQGGAGASGAVELSPYMVAFVAFVSGFMAEDAFSRIQEAGRNLFGSDEDSTPQ